MAAVTFGVIEYLNFSGFCYAKGRYLSDDELIRSAIEYSLKQQPSEASNIRYDSVEEFISRNSDCCVIRKENRGEFENVLDGRWIRLIGVYVLVIDVWYQFKEAGPNNYYDSSIAMTSCGNVTERHRSLSSRSRIRGKPA